MSLTTEPTAPPSTSCLAVLHGNARVGTFFVLEDGYYAFEPTKASGYFSPTNLRGLAAKLDELNAAWNTLVQAARPRLP